MATVEPKAHLTDNEIYQRLKQDGRTITELSADKTDYKKLIAGEPDHDKKVVLADKLAVKRLADGVLPELDECYAALRLQ